MNSAAHSEYRPDIDGLRAVAVLCVIGFHAFPSSVRGGFIGVDIFFVISGFLISGIIYEALRRGRFSYFDFYARRIRRIFPALLTVLAACLLAGWFLLLPDEYKQLGQQTAASAGFAANILFWSQAGYFDTDSAVKPLLHLWSLGIEEQFYLLWPILLALIYGRMRRLPVAVGCLLLASFLWNIAFIGSNPSAAFYLPMARFWELLSGSMLSYLMISGAGRRERAMPQQSAGADRPAVQSFAPEVLSACGLSLIVAALVLITADSRFPGWWALLPVVGTILIIAARTSRLNRALLSNRALVFVGLISYPLYLWHWALLALIRSRAVTDGGEASKSVRIMAVALSFLLAWLTYALIERPIRFGVRNAFRPAALLALMALIGGLGYVVNLTDGAAFRYPGAIRPLAAFQHDSENRHFDGVYRTEICLLGAQQTFADLGPGCIDNPSPNSKLVVLWGDSHAAALYSGLRERQASNGGIRLAQFTANACPPVLGQDFFKRPNCRAFNDAAFVKIRSLNPDVVVMEGDWSFYYQGSGGWNKLDLAALQATVNRLKSIGVRRVVVFGNLPVWKFAQPEVGLKVWLDTRTLTDRNHSYIDATSIKVDSMVRAAIANTGAIFVSPIDALCNDAGCLLSTNPGKWTPVAWDTAHLTETGSSLLIGSSAAAIFGNRSIGSRSRN